MAISRWAPWLSFALCAALATIGGCDDPGGPEPDRWIYLFDTHPGVSISSQPASTADGDTFVVNVICRPRFAGPGSVDVGGLWYASPVGVTIDPPGRSFGHLSFAKDWQAATPDTTTLVFVLKDGLSDFAVEAVCEFDSVLVDGRLLPVGSSALATRLGGPILPGIGASISVH